MVERQSHLIGRKSEKAAAITDINEGAEKISMKRKGKKGVEDNEDRSEIAAIETEQWKNFQSQQGKFGQNNHKINLAEKHLSLAPRNIKVNYRLVIKVDSRERMQHNKKG